MPYRRSRRLGLLALVVGMIWVGLAGAAAKADAYFLTIDPSVRGFGTVVGPAVGCTNTNQNPGTLVPCAPAFLSDGNPFTFGVFNYTAVASGHWQFDGWEICANPIGVTCRRRRHRVGTIPLRARFRDLTAPTVTAATAVFSTTVNSGVSFNLAANEPLASATCSVGGRPAQPCNTPQVVPEGTHTVQVSGRDLSGKRELALGQPDVGPDDRHAPDGRARHLLERQAADVRLRDWRRCRRDLRMLAGRRGVRRVRRDVHSAGGPGRGRAHAPRARQGRPGVRPHPARAHLDRRQHRPEHGPRPVDGPA